MKKAILFPILLLIATIHYGQDGLLEQIDFYTIDDLDFSVFESPEYKNYYNKTYDTRHFMTRYFSPWSNPRIEMPKEEWRDFFSYDGISKKSPCYAGNYRPYSEELICALSDNLPSNRAGFPHLLKYAMTISAADVRILPTEEFCLKAMRDAGEGYPFDYLQSTALWAGTPVLIVSQTNDRLWYYVYTPYNKGWIKADRLAFASREQITALKKMEYGAIIKEGLVLKGKGPAVKLNIGALLPLVETGSGKNLLIPHRSFGDQALVFDTVSIQGNEVADFPMSFDAGNVKRILSELVGGKYSWGGLDGGRDCSSMLKDYLTPFGIWMPRNSGGQFKSGRQVALKGSHENKLVRIKTKGVPFLSSVFKWGHIMLYVGESREGEPLIFQTVWGLKVFFKDEHLKEISDHREKYGIFGIDERDFIKDEVQARVIIGKTVITSVEPGKKLRGNEKFRVDAFLDHIFMLTVLPDKPGR